MLYLDSNGKFHLDPMCEEVGEARQKIVIFIPLGFMLANRCNHCGTAEDFETEAGEAIPLPSLEDE
jgi:hypothetical protein